MRIRLSGSLVPLCLHVSLIFSVVSPAEMCVPNQLPALLLRYGDAKKPTPPLDTGSPVALGSCLSQVPAGTSLSECHLP